MQYSGINEPQYDDITVLRNIGRGTPTIDKRVEHT